MIFVTVGTFYIGFERLIIKMDEIAGKITEEVIMQIGSTKYKPKHAKYFKYKKSDEIIKLIRNARVVVCHGGAGTILDALSIGKPIIAVPRLIEYDEILIDHQKDLLNALSKEKQILVVNDIDELDNLLEIDLKPVKKNNNQKLIKFIKKLINN